MGTVATATVLFTDMVRSTALRTRLGDELADAVMADHDALLDGALALSSGTLVKRLGDGVLATFGSAVQALEAAALVQRRVEQYGRRFPERRFALRVGLSSGDVSLDEDVSGTPVVEAFRLCEAAEGGQVLCSDVVRVLVGSRAPGALHGLGPVSLRGLPDTLVAHRLAWEPLPGDGSLPDHGVPLPALLVGVDHLAYVGRVAELATLRAALDQALAGASGSILLGGEPGIGKTRTAAELARLAFDAGAVVLYGRCDEDLGAPYQPFVEALDGYVRSAGAPRLGRLARELVRLVPELPELVPGTGEPVASDPRTEEYRLFEAVAAWLVEASRESGLVLVLDDLHWADAPTLSLLLHVLRAAAPSSGRLLVVGTYRDGGLRDDDRLAAVLADLRRLPGSVRTTLTGLDRDEVLQLLTSAAGHGLDAVQEALALRVSHESDGNPFFVAELLRHLVETEALQPVEGRWQVMGTEPVEVPVSIREVVGRRLRVLTPACLEVLTAAAVLGRDFPIDVLVAQLGLAEAAVLDQVEEAVRARLVEETGTGTYRFSHVLVRAALYEKLSTTRRARAHQRAAAALERLRPDDLVALAHHGLRAAPTGEDLVRAATWQVRAGEQALASRALAEAAERLRAALERLDPDVPAQRGLAARALCGLGEAQRDLGDQAYRATLGRAAELADQAGEVDLLVRAALADDRGTTIVAPPDAGRIARVERALELVDRAPSVSRARLLTRLVGETTFSGDPVRRRRLTQQAETMARQLEDQQAVAHVMVRTAMAAHMTCDWRTSLARARQCVALADGVGDPALRCTALSWLTSSFVVAGDLAAAEETTAQMAVVAREASPAMGWFARLAQVKFLSLRGRFDEASAENDACLDLALELKEPDAEGIWGAVAAAIAVNAGASAAFADAAGAFADRYPTVPNWRAGHVAFLAEAGRRDEAAQVLRTYPMDPARLMEEPFAYQGPFSLSTAAAELQDGLLGRRVHRVLSAHRGRWSHLYVGVLGPVTWALGRCAQATGALDVAVEDLTAALMETRQAQAHALSGLVALDLAATLARRAGTADRHLALEVLEELGDGGHLDERVDRLRDELAS